MGCFTQGTHHILNVVTFVEAAQLAGGFTYSLHHQGNGAFFYVSLSNGQGNTFSMFSCSDNDKVPGFTCLGDAGSFNIKAYHQFRKFRLTDNLVHIPLVKREARVQPSTLIVMASGGKNGTKIREKRQYAKAFFG